MADLTKRLEAAWAAPVAGEEPFDLAGELETVLGGVGLAVDDAGGEVTTTGADPVVPSPMRIGGAARIGLLTKSVAAAAVHRWRGGPGGNGSAATRSRRRSSAATPWRSRSSGAPTGAG
jgi:hypothetical protein